MNLCDLVSVPPPKPEHLENARKILNFCKTPQARTAASRSYSDKRIQILPGIFSDDHRLGPFLKEVSSFSLKEGVEDVSGFYLGPYPGPSLDKARSRAGSSILPLSYSERRLKGEEEVDDNIVMGIKSLMRVVTKNRIRTYGRISKGSGVGFPFCLSDMELKKFLMLRALRGLPRIFELIRKKNLRGLYEEFDILLLSNTQIRRQCDAYNKRREISLFESTLSSPVKIKDVRPLDPLMEEQRTRVVYAFSWIANILGTIFGDGYRTFMDLSFAETFKHRGPDDVCNKLTKAAEIFGDSFRAYGVDFSRYDTTIPEYALLTFIDCFPVPEEIKELMRYQIYAPHYSSNDGRGSSLMDGDPLDSSSFSFYRGLSSGVWFTSMAGKVVAVGTILGRLRELGLLRAGRDGLIPEPDVRGFLRHNHPIVKVYCLNQSDDTILFGDRNQVISLFRKMESGGPFKVEKEPTTVFLGYIFYIEEGSRKIRYQLSLSSYLIGIWVPERSYDDPNFRPYGILGLTLRERIDVYGSNVQFEEFKDFHDFTFSKFFENDFKTLLNAHMKLPIIDLDLVESDLPLAVDLISDPSKALWKYNEIDLKPYQPLLESFSSAILPEIVEGYVSRYQRDDIIEKETIYADVF